MKKISFNNQCLSILGTGSDVGKSVVVTALCRIFSDMGIRVAPYKAQNMSNNSGVTPEDLEMGRAQIVQAEAARLTPHVDMNPVLLKPSSDTGAQVVVLGRPIGNHKAGEYFSDTTSLAQIAEESLNRLRNEYELIVMEGAGSCAEINLRKRDFVNFHMAHASNSPVVLVADIDRGGVFAQIIGTLEVLSKEDRKRIRGFIINRFRGDAELFDDGIKEIEKRTGLPVLGLIPFYRNIEIDSEDGMLLETLLDPSFVENSSEIKLAVIRMPHISNFTDFFPFSRLPNVRLQYLTKPRDLKGYDVVYLPGSKNARADSKWLFELGWNRTLLDYAAGGGRIHGICGGYQILGQRIIDPHGLEGEPGETEGLGLLDVNTTLKKDKTLSLSKGIWEAFDESVEGYEIHMGTTEQCGSDIPLIRLSKREGVSVGDYDGFSSQDGIIWGCYFHGLFDSPNFLKAYLCNLRPNDISIQNLELPQSTASFKNHQYDLLAAHFLKHLDKARLLEILNQLT